MIWVYAHLPVIGVISKIRENRRPFSIMTHNAHGSLGSVQRKWNHPTDSAALRYQQKFPQTYETAQWWKMKPKEKRSCSCDVCTCADVNWPNFIFLTHWMNMKKYISLKKFILKSQIQMNVEINRFDKIKPPTSSSATIVKYGRQVF